MLCPMHPKIEQICDPVGGQNITLLVSEIYTISTLACLDINLTAINAAGTLQDHLVSWVERYLYQTHSRTDATRMMDGIDRR